MSQDEKPRVLMVDDEPNVLAAFRRALVRRYSVVTADGAERALAIMDREGPFPVIVTDMRMPCMDGLAFLKEAHQRHPDAVCIMLTGNADQETAVRAINEGRIFRFLTKPCAPDRLDHALRAGLRQHELITAERVLLRETLSGSVRVLAEVLTLSEPDLAAAAASIRRTIHAMTRELGLESEWRYPLAGSLCLFGVLVEGNSQRKGWRAEERLESGARIGARLLRNIPRFADVATMIERQREIGPLPDDTGMEDPQSRVTIGARLLRFAVDLERRASDGEPLDRLRAGLRELGHDERLLVAARDVMRARASGAENGAEGAGEEETPSSVEALPARELRPGMLLAEDVVTSDSKLLLSKGRELTPVLIERMRSLARSGVIRDRIEVTRPEEGGTGGEAPEAGGGGVGCPEDSQRAA